MITQTIKLPKSFVDFDSPGWEKIVDELLAEVDETKIISFEEFFERTNKFRLNLWKNAKI